MQIEPAQRDPAHAQARPDAPRGGRIAVVAVAAAVVLAVLVALHVPGLNGPWYWKWRWARLPAVRWYFWMALAALPAAAAVAIEMRGPTRARWQRFVLLMLLAVSVVAIKVLSLASVTHGLALTRLDAIVRDSDSTSYFTDAAALASVDRGWSWIGNYHVILRVVGLHLHTLSKPPGPVAYYMFFIRGVGYSNGAVPAGLVLALLAALGVPAAYWLMLLLGGDARVACVAAVILCMCPGFELIYPTFDAAFVLPSALMLGAWHLALRSRRAPMVAWVLVAALTAAAALFMSYSFLVLGFFMLGDALVAWRAEGHRALAVIARALFMPATVAAIYLLLFLTIGFHPIDTFRSALQNQRELLQSHAQYRPYPWTILFDLTDFVFSAGWITLLPVIAALAALRAEPTPRRLLIILAVAQPVAVAVSGQLQSETARVWNFMLPLLILPAAFEVARWQPWARGLFYLSLLLVLLVVGQNMVFLNPPPVAN
jgi:hypothetical protein